MDEQTRKALRKHRAELEQEMELVKIEAQRVHDKFRDLKKSIDAVEVLLGPEKQAEPDEGNTDWLDLPEPKVGSSLKGMGFRDAVRTILSEHPDGLTTGQIRAELENRGYLYEASTPLPVRISNDTRRMILQGMLRRRNGRMSLTEKGREMAQEN